MYSPGDSESTASRTTQAQVSGRNSRSKGNIRVLISRTGLAG